MKVTISEIGNLQKILLRLPLIGGCWTGVEGVSELACYPGCWRPEKEATVQLHCTVQPLIVAETSNGRKLCLMARSNIVR